MSPPENDAAPRVRGGGHDTRSQPPVCHSSVTLGYRRRPLRRPDRPDCGDCGDRQVLDNGRPCRCQLIGWAAEVDLGAVRLAGSDPVHRLEGALRLLLDRALAGGTHRPGGAARLAAATKELVDVTSSLALEAAELHDLVELILAGVAHQCAPMGVAA